MGAGGQSNPDDLHVKKSDHQVMKRAPTSKPPFTLSDLRKAIPPHCFDRSFIKSFSFVIADYTAVAILCYLATTFIPYLPRPLQYLAWPIYWYAQGSVFMGLWVIGHDCMHNAFSKYEWVDDTVGFFVHTYLMTPFFSVKYSHRRHHSHTASLERDETFVPKVKTELDASKFILDNAIGRFLTLCVKLTAGWYIYLFMNAAGRPYERWASHYDPMSPIFSKSERVMVVVSDIGLLGFCYLLYKIAMVQGWAWLICAYGVPLIVMDAFLVTITYLHHTHPMVPHYDDTEWNWMRGALATIDRDYGILNRVLNNMTDTHVAHHLFPYIPHYNAMDATKAIKPILGEFYQFDNTPYLVALWRETKLCLFIEPEQKEDGEKKGIYWFNNKY